MSKRYRCPWCGEQCITPIDKAGYLDRSYADRFFRMGKPCPACNRRFTFPQGRPLEFVLMLGVVLLLTFLGFRYGDGYFWSLLIYALLMGLVVMPIRHVFFQPVVRCADEGYQHLSIPTPYRIRTEEKISLRQEDIFVVRFPEGHRNVVAHRDMADTPLPVHLCRTETPLEYRMGFLQPFHIRPEQIAVGAAVELLLADGRPVSAYIVSTDEKTAV